MYGQSPAHQVFTIVHVKTSVFLIEKAGGRKSSDFPSTSF